MRILPRFRLPRWRSVTRVWQRWQRHLTVARCVYAVELLLLIGALWWMCMGSCAAAIDRYGERGDAPAAGNASQ